MAFVKKIEIEIGVLGIWKLSESVTDLISQFQFSEKEITEFSRIKVERRKKEYIATRLLLNELLDKRPEITYLDSGKPELKNSIINISISHSSDFVVVIISEKNVGIDVENTQRNINKIATRFLSKNELTHISYLSDKQKITVLYWSAKEAVFKCTNKNGVQFNKQIIIQPFEIENKGKFAAILNKSTHYKLWYFFLENNVIVYCVE
ncbi:MAG: 4'-phosphopantetheinyl transferase superfamily protein [Draconibacterium sp.]|nr:4'-phosphopantetheinyl transferase superfamily protein [Draconibacterium sp.]